jgi:two-component system response regulator YesN
VRQILLRLICTCLQEGQLPPIHLKHNSPLVERAIAYIQSHLRINLTISEISSHLFVSESKLRATFLAETGTTIGQYIDKQVLAQAKQLLATQRRSISEISAMLGFCDQFYFSRCFTKRFSLSPQKFRKIQSAK